MDDTRKQEPRPQQPETKVVSGGRNPFSYHGFVNPPVYHA